MKRLLLAALLTLGLGAPRPAEAGIFSVLAYVDPSAADAALLREAGDARLYAVDAEGGAAVDLAEFAADQVEDEPATVTTEIVTHPWMMAVSAIGIGIFIPFAYREWRKPSRRVEAER